MEFSKMALLLCALCFCLRGNAQENVLSVEAGIEFGWWLHQLGDSQLGVSKTHHTGSPFVHFNYLWAKQKWYFGPTLRAGLFLEDDMRNPRDSRFRYDRIFIAKEDGFIPFLRYGLRVERQLLRRGAYTFAPALHYGLFNFWTTHPDKANFGYQHFTEILFSHIWHRPKRDWILSMNYNTQRIFLRQKTEAKEQHHLYSWGMSVGIRFK